MDKKMIDKLRVYYKLPDVITDAQIGKELKGSLGESLLNIETANNQLKKALYDIVPGTLKKYFN